MQAMVEGTSPPLTDNGSCNELFLRPDAVLVVVITSALDDEGALGGESLGDPDSWHASVVAAKGGNDNAIVVGGLIGDNLQPIHFCEDNEAEDADNLRSFIEGWGAHGVEGSACNPGTFFDDLVAAIDDACG